MGVSQTTMSSQLCLHGEYNEAVFFNWNGFRTHTLTALVTVQKNMKYYNAFWLAICHCACRLHLLSLYIYAPSLMQRMSTCKVSENLMAQLIIMCIEVERGKKSNKLHCASSKHQPNECMSTSNSHCLLDMYCGKCMGCVCNVMCLEVCEGLL